MNTIKAEYLGHSGFLFETEKALLLFDYFRGDLSVISDKPADKALYVFVSHAHRDHFNPDIFSFTGKDRAVRYILSFDLKGNEQLPEQAEEDGQFLFLDADGKYDIPGLGAVETFLSTDEGVAFLVDTGDAVIYHAGDLHWWDWEEPDPAVRADREKRYMHQIRKLSGQKIDAACVVLDDRLGDHFANGMNRFLAVCQASYVFPMHYWEDMTVIERFRDQEDEQTGHVQIMDTVHEKRWEMSLKPHV